MTSKEAIEKIKYRITTAKELVGCGENGDAFEDLEIAIKALEQIDKLENLAEQNLIGKTVYTVCAWGVENDVVDHVMIFGDGDVFLMNKNDGFIANATNAFLTKEEAEDARKKLYP